MPKKKNNTAKPAENKDKSKDSIFSPEESAIDAALSASLDGLYQNDFEHPAEDDIQNMPEHIAEDFDDEIVDLTKNNDFSEDGSETLKFTQEAVIPEEEPEEFTEEDEILIADISDALAVQINSEISKSGKRRKKKHSFWWLLTLIPFLGIFIMMIRKLRKGMPKILMVLRVLVFFTFAVLLIGTVATDGELDYWLVSKYSASRMTISQKTEFMPLPLPSILNKDEKDKNINALVTVKGEKENPDIQLFISYNEIWGRLSIYPVAVPVTAEFDSITETFERTCYLKLDAVFEVKADGFIKFVNKLKGLDISLSKVEADELKNLKVKRYKKIDSGMNNLKGDAVYQLLLMSAKTLEYPEGEMSRATRQIAVSEALVKKLTEGSKFRSLLAANKLLKSVKTNIDSEQINDFLLTVAKNKIRNNYFDYFDNRNTESDFRKLVYGEEDLTD